MTQTLDRLMPKPRSISPRLWFQLLASPVVLGASVVFGLLCVFMGPFFRGWAPGTDWLLMWASREAPGRITSVRETSYEENEVQVYQYRYEFRLPDGTTRQGASYSTGHCLAPEAIPPEGYPVTVEYHPRHVAASRIRDGRTSPFGIYWLFFIFPGIPLLLGVAGVRHAFRQIRLLRNGDMTEGRVLGLFLDRNPKDSESSAEFIPLAEATAFPPTGKSTRCTFEFTAPGGARVEGTGHVLFVGDLFGQPKVTVLYDPSRPADAMLLDEIEARTTGAGEWEPTGKPPSAAFLTLALLGLIGGPYLAWLASLQPVGLH